MTRTVDTECEECDRAKHTNIPFRDMFYVYNIPFRDRILDGMSGI